MSARESAAVLGRRVLTAALAAVTLLLIACLSYAAPGSGIRGSARTSRQIHGSVQAPGRAQMPARGTAAHRTTPADIMVTPADLSVAVLPSAPVRVRASTGTVRTVALVDATGRKVHGRSSRDGTWQSSELLRPSMRYTFTIAATRPDGTATSSTSSFRTLTPTVSATYSLIPRDGTVGVGMPVTVQFDSAVTTPARRAQVERRIKITTAPVQVGAWGWLDDRQLMWRPRTFWRPGTTVTLSTPLHGVQTGDDKWITADDEARFRVGSSTVSSVDMHAHTLTVRRNGVAIRRFPVSTGKPGPLTETRSGIKVIIERNRAIVMDSATVGIPKSDPRYYKIPTRWNLRLTWTGEFIHSAPWSVGAQGSQNVSHGCTNMAPADAEWMFRNSTMGDVVAFSGSSRAFRPTEGIGVWVYDFAGWKARSALT